MITMRKVNLSRLNSTLEKEYDLFICSSSFEERCLSVAEKIKRKSIKKFIILENANGSETIHLNTKKLEKIFPQNQKTIKINFMDPIGIADSLSDVISKGFCGRKISVLLDVTAFTHEVLMICLKILKLKRNVASVTCVYTNAADYCPGMEWEKKWLSRGSGELHTVLGYSGLLFPSQKDRLIVIVGYEHRRAIDVISLYEPNELTIVYGSPDNVTTEKNREANQCYAEFVEAMSFQYDNIERVNIPCDNPDKTCDILSQLYESHQDENLIIIPMNNKLSTIGVVKSLLDNEDVQACYSPAIIYNENNYSIPGNNCYIYKFI